MATRKRSATVEPVSTQTKPKLDESQRRMADKIMSDFLELAGWGSDDDSKADELAAIDERIESFRQQIAQLEQTKKDFDNREQVARDFVEQMIVLFGATANEKTILDNLCVRTNTAAPKKKRNITKPKVDDDVVQKVADVLDGEGMNFGEIKKALDGMDSALIRKALDKLLGDKAIDKSGERKATKYFLLDVGSPEPQPEPEPEQVDDDGEEYDE